MKKTMSLTLLLLLFFASATNAQIQKGKWITGLSLATGASKYESSATNRVQKFGSTDIQFGIGYFLNKKSMIGAALSYGNNFNKDYFASDTYSNNKFNTWSYGLSFHRFFSMGKSFYYIPDIYFRYSSGKTENKNVQPGFIETTYKASTKGIEANIDPLVFGYLYKERFLFTLGFSQVKYSFLKTKSNFPNNNDADGTSSGFNIYFKPQISNIGISLIF